MPLYSLPASSSVTPPTLAAALDLSSNGNSSVLYTGKSIVGVQIHVVNTDAAGKFFVQSTIDGTNWIKETFLDGANEVTVTASANVDTIIHLQLGSLQLRVRWEGTSTSDTALITAITK
jgi:hypothetical protein